MVSDYIRKLRLIPRDVWLAMVPYVSLYFLFFGVYAVIFNLYLLRMGFGPRYVGLVNAAGWLTHTAMSPVSGTLGQRWGVRRTMLVGICLALVGFCAVALTDLLPQPWQAGWALVTYVLGFIGLNGVLVSSPVYLVTGTDPASRDHAFAMRQAASPLSATLGGLLSGALPGAIAGALGITTQSPIPFRYVLLGGGLLQVVGLAAVLRMRELERPATAPSQRMERGRLPLHLIAPMFLFGLLRWAGRSPSMTFMNVYLDAGLGVSAETIGLIQAVGQFSRFPTALLVPALTGAVGHRRVLLGGTLAMGLLMVPLALLPHPLVAGVCAVGLILAFGMSDQVNSVYSQELVEPAWRSAMSGAMSMASGLGISAMSLGGGEMIATLGYVELFLMSGAASLLAAGALQALVPGKASAAPQAVERPAC